MKHLILDLDGVCVDSIPLILKLMNKRYGKEITLEQLTEYDLRRIYGSDAYEVYQEIEEYVYLLVKRCSCAR